MQSVDKTYDAIVVGGGHNGLVAACYLSKAKKRVLLLEDKGHLGGATSSKRLFEEYDANLSRYSYLVSLLPDQIISDLGIQFKTLTRSISSYTPHSVGGQDDGLFVTDPWSKTTAESFRRLTGSDAEGHAWRNFYGQLGTMAARFAPSLLHPLKTREDLKLTLDLPDIWDRLISEPIGGMIREHFDHDVTRGVALTDALIGTFVSSDDMRANACFLYHLIGNGTGQWRVPQGGMGRLISELHRVAIDHGVQILQHSKVVKLESGANGVAVETESGHRHTSRDLLFAAAPSQLASLQNTEPSATLEGSQLKINMLVKQLPRLKSGIDPEQAFAGTLHINESDTQLQHAYEQAIELKIPEPLPLEIYCHTLTDASILSQELATQGFHTLTLFGLHTPANLFDTSPDQSRSDAMQLALASLNEYLLDPIESVLATCRDGSAAIEVVTPLDLEKEISLPRGNIFHGELTLPLLYEQEAEELQQPSWGVETDDPHVFIAGAGARRGGGVSGIPGHNAAMAVLARS